MYIQYTKYYSFVMYISVDIYMNGVHTGVVFEFKVLPSEQDHSLIAADPCKLIS